MNDSKTIQTTNYLRGSKQNGVPNISVEDTTKCSGINLGMKINWKDHDNAMWIQACLRHIYQEDKEKIWNISNQKINYQYQYIRYLADFIFKGICRRLFQEDTILTLPELCISELLLLVVSSNKPKHRD